MHESLYSYHCVPQKELKYEKKKPESVNLLLLQTVPARFANNFNGHISEEVNLRSPSGETWSIGVANSDAGELVLQPGWKEFVDGNGIEEGDCLLFRYSGVSSSFDVLIFDPSGCEKATPHFVENRGFGREEKSAGAEGGGRDGDKNGHHQHQLEMTPHKNSSRCRSIPSACKRGLFSDEIGMYVTQHNTV